MMGIMLIGTLRGQTMQYEAVAAHQPIMGVAILHAGGFIDSEWVEPSATARACLLAVPVAGAITYNVPKSFASFTHERAEEIVPEQSEKPPTTAIRTSHPRHRANMRCGHGRKDYLRARNGFL